jgi:hypothetical protein
MHSIAPQSLNGIFPEDLECVNGTLERTRYAVERHEDCAEAFVVVAAIIEHSEAKDSTIAPVNKRVNKSVYRSRRRLGDYGEEF